VCTCIDAHVHWACGVLSAHVCIVHKCHSVCIMNL